MSIKVPSAGDLGLGQAIQTNNLAPRYQDVNYNPVAFGAEQGRQLEKLGGNIESLGLVMNKMYDDQTTSDSYKIMNQIDDDIRTTHYEGDGAIYNRRGGAALTAYKDSEKALNESYVKNTQNIDNQTREKVNRLYAVKRDGILDKSALFEAGQRGVYKADETQALINNSIDDSIKNYNNPQIVKYNVATMKYAIDQAIPALPEGSSDDLIKGRDAMVKEKTSEALDKTYTGVIQKFAANGQTATAKKFYAAVKDDISGPNQIKLDAMMREGSLRGQAQAQFDKINNSGKSEADQLAMARSIKDPELRDDVEARVKRSWNEPKTQLQRAKDLATAEAWKMAVNDFAKPEQIPLEIWTTIDDDQKKKIQKFSNDGPPQKSNLITYADLKDQYVNNPEEFKKANLFSYANELNSDDFKYFSERQNDLIKGGKSNQVSVRTYNEIGKQRLEALGIDTSLSDKNSKTNKQKSALFFRSLDEQVQAFVDENNRKPKDSEVETMIDKMTESIAFDKGWFSKQTDKYRFEIDGNTDYSDVVVPESARLQIIKQVQARNPSAALSEDQIKQIYTKKFRQQ